MTKFEEELFNKVPCKFELTTEAEYKKTTLINHFKNWHSDEEFQELLDKYSNLNDHYEKEVIRSSKLETSNLKLIAEGTGLLSDNAMLTKKVEDLKSQLQQQALPVVPKCVSEWIECVKGKNNNALALLDDDNMPDNVNEWLFFQRNDDNINLILRAWLDGYQVEKPQLFEVKMPIVYWDDDASQLTNGFDFLRIDKETDEVDFVGFLSNTKKHTVHFTEQEIKSIDERYWQFAVPVEDGE